jgi:Geminivirus rep protein central domain
MPQPLNHTSLTSQDSTVGFSQGAGTSNTVSLGNNLGTTEQNWVYITEGTTPDKVMQWVIERDPYMVVMNLQELQRFIEYKFCATKEPFISKYGAEGFPCVTAEMQWWVDKELRSKVGGPKHLYFMGQHGLARQNGQEV